MVADVQADCTFSIQPNRKQDLVLQIEIREVGDKCGT